jgi:hypothetical protein
VIFKQESLDNSNTDSELMISIIEAIAQAEKNPEAILSNGVLNKEQHKALPSFIIVSYTERQEV